MGRPSVPSAEDAVPPRSTPHRWGLGMLNRGSFDFSLCVDAQRPDGPMLNAMDSAPRPRHRGLTGRRDDRARHLAQAAPVPSRSASGSVRDLRLSTSTQDIWPAQPGCAGLSHPACPAVPPAPDPVPSRAMPVFGRDARQRRLAQPRGSGARLAQRRPGAAGPGSSPYAPPVGLCAEADHSETTGGAAAGEDRGLAPEPRESTGMAADTDWPGSARF